ncbi:MAG: hypothetical protein OYM47_20075 [Gemmatimonadota bacterium]|nr:hypothetical protein [Gemmatimonadota bacterium]
MLNEVFHLSESLKRTGVTLHSWHRHFKECPKGGQAFFVELDDQGHVANVAPITDPQIRAELRKYEKAAGYSFPSFNVPPLMQFADQATKERAAKFRKALGSKKPPETAVRDKELAYLLSVCRSGWIRSDKGARSKDAMDKLNDCLSSVTHDVMTMLGESTEESRSFVELLRRAQQTDGAALHERLKEIAMREIRSEQSEAAEWMDVLFFHSGKVPKNIAITLELVDQSQFAYPANHPKVQAWVNDRLLATETIEERHQGRLIAADAFGGVEGGGMNDSFPEIKVPVLGNVKLRAMSSESPCQRRYGLADARSFYVLQPARLEMKTALEWVTRDERRGKTWHDVSSLGGASAMLITYPSELPTEAPELAGLFCGVEGDRSDPDGSLFEACSHRVAKALKGRLVSSRNAELRVFVLTKPDGFRTKVLHSSRYSIQHLLDSADEWQEFCRNSPPVMIRQFGLKRGEEPVWQRPITPYPAEVVWCLNTVWQRMGTHAESAFDFQIADGLSLLLADDPVLRTVATRAIKAITSNSLSLLLVIGQAIHLGKVHRMGRVYGKQALLLPQILGLLLAKLDYKKGIYMKNPPYLIGRLLSLADQLHVQYCHEVRKGQVPLQLVGNGLMTNAMDTPEFALALFWQRIKPYYSWAQTVQGGEEVRLAKYFLGEIGRVCASLSERDMPSRCSDTDKVAMLLGYLARSDREKSNDDSSKTLNEGEQE